MATKLAFQPRKWDKERRDLEKTLQSFKDPDYATTEIKKITDYYINVEASQRNYWRLYNRLQLKYRLLADDCYLVDKDEKACIEYIYLSGVSGVLSNLFDTQEEKNKRELADAQNTVVDFEYALLRLFATDQLLPNCIHEMNHVYIKLFQGEFNQVEVLLSQLGNRINSSNPYRPYVSDLDRSCIQAIVRRDSKTLQDELIKHIKDYRKGPAGLGYSVFVDVFSIVFMKLAQQYDMSCEIDIIEIPHLFFDKDGCKIDKEKVKPPFFEEAITVLKNRNIDF